jgi:hypothetical protein
MLRTAASRDEPTKASVTKLTFATSVKRLSASRKKHLLAEVKQD